MGAWVPIAVLGLATPVPGAVEVDEARVVLQTRAAVAGLDTGDILRRSSQELRARGFVVDAVPSTDGPLEDELRAAARPRGAALAVGIVMLSRAAVELTVLDRVTGKHLTRALDLSGSDNVASMVALATGELVEASLVELRMRHETVVAEVEPPADLPVPEVPTATGPPSRPPPPRWAGEVGMSASWPTRTRTAGLILGLELIGFPIARLGLGLWADVAALAPAGHYRGSTIRSRPISFGGALRANAVLRDRVVVPVELRGGAVALRVDADSTMEVEGRSFSRWMGLVSLQTGVLGKFSPGHAGFMVGAGLPLQAPRLTAVPNPAMPEEQLVILDLRGPWLTATAVVGLHW